MGDSDDDAGAIRACLEAELAKDPRKPVAKFPNRFAPRFPRNSVVKFPWNPATRFPRKIQVEVCKTDVHRDCDSQWRSRQAALSSRRRRRE